MLERTTDPRERIVLLQHAIDGIVGTFYTQVMFADFELQAHRLVEEGKPMTADVLERHLLRPVEGVQRRRDRLRPAVAHHLGAHSAFLRHAVLRLPVRDLLRVERADPEADPGGARAGAAGRGQRYLSLLRAGGSDHPMALLQRAGVDLASRRRSRPSFSSWTNW